MDMDSKGNKFWGSFVVRNSKGVIICRGEIYSHDDALPEHAFMRVASRFNKHCLIKFVPGVRWTEAE